MKVWKPSPDGDQNMHLLHDSAGEVIGCVLYDLKSRWAATDQDGKVLGWHPTSDAAKRAVEEHLRRQHH